MSLFQFATTSFRGMRAAIASFHPKTLPPMLRSSYGRELVAWWFLPLMLGAIEGGVISVIVKKAFASVESISPAQLNFAVAAVTAAPSLANITSFMWASVTHGRSKIKFITWMQIATAVCVGAIALAPRSLSGLILLTAAVYAARICWTGVILIRTAVWRNNYPRADRARIAGKLASVQAIVLCVVAFALGLAMDANELSFHYLFPLAAVGGLIGTAIYGKVRFRGQRRLMRAEMAGAQIERPSINPVSVYRVLAGDPLFRRFMIIMFVFGLGNIMLIAPTAIILQDVFALGYWPSILITSAIPDIAMPFAIPLWARLLDRAHVVQFRSIHAWSYVTASLGMLIAVTTGQVWLLFCSAVIVGIADAGGVLAWNLGHNDFAKDHNASQYMGVHVTLTGIRGLIAPFLGVGIYQLLEHWRPGSGVWTFAPCLALNFIGALGFGTMWRSMSAIRAPSARSTIAAPVAGKLLSDN
ncbi:MAG: MFS transporter [Phycisphaerales bacterium]|nr:MFS transporter [Phycisphaerales bacterium]